MRHLPAVLALLFSGFAAAQFEDCNLTTLRYHEDIATTVLSQGTNPPTYSGYCHHNAATGEVGYTLELFDPLSVRMGEDIIHELLGNTASVEVELRVDGWQLHAERGAAVVDFTMRPVSEIPDPNMRSAMEAQSILFFGYYVFKP